MRAALFVFVVLSATFATAAPRTYTLPELVQLAEKGNADLQVVREKAAQALLAIDKAYAVLLPTLTLGGAYTRNSIEAKLAFPSFSDPWQIQPTSGPDAQTGKFSAFLIPTALTEAPIQPYNQFGAQARLSAPLFVMPAYDGIEIAKDSARATAMGIAHVRDEVCFGIAQAYYGAAGAQRFASLTRALLESAQAQESLAEAKVKSGQAPKLELLRASTERARAEQDVRRAENAYKTALLAISSLTGAELPFDVAPPPAEVTPPAGTAPELVAKALASRQDLASNRAVVRISERAVDATWEKFVPVIAANADLRYTNVATFTGANTTWLVQLAASMTLYDRSLFVEVDEARSRVREAEANVRATERRIVQDVQSAILELESAQANVQKSREQDRLASEAATLADASYRAGATTSLELNDANTARRSAGVALVAEELGLQLAGLKLAKAMGRLGDLLPIPAIPIPE